MEQQNTIHNGNELNIKAIANRGDGDPNEDLDLDIDTGDRDNDGLSPAEPEINKATEANVDLPIIDLETTEMSDNENLIPKPCSNETLISYPCSNETLIPKPYSNETSSPKPCTTNEETLNDSSLLNNAVVKHEKSCEDDLDSTIAICKIFNSKSDHETCDEISDNNSAVDTSREIIITDLDAMTCNGPQKESNMETETSQQIDSRIDISDTSDKSDMSPQIILLDLQSQDELVTDYIRRRMDNAEKMKEDESEIFDTADSEQIQSSESFCFVDEPKLCGEESALFENQSDDIFPPDFVKEKKFNQDAVFFHDLNYDYEHMHSKPFDRSENIESDTVIYISEGCSQMKDETKGMYVSPKVSTVNPYSDAEFNSPSFDFPVNDSGFFDTSHFSSGKNASFNVKTSDLPDRLTNQILGINSSKCSMGGHIFEEPPSENNPAVGFKVPSHFLNLSESHLVTENIPSTTFSVPNTPNSSLMNPHSYKQSVINYGIPYQQGLPPFSDHSETYALSAYPEWNSWNNGNNQEPSLCTVSSSPYITSQLPQSSCVWHGDSKKMESAEVYHEYLKPAITDNDSEETEDADEFDDVPLFFSTPTNLIKGYERQWQATPSSCYSEEAPGSQFGSEIMSPSPSLGNTPVDNCNTSIIYSPSHLTTTCKQANIKLENAFMPYDLGSSPKLPYPSMADMMRSSRSTSTKSSGVTVKRLLADNVSQGGRFRKNQIQSDTISTSTSKSTRYKKKWVTDQKKSEPSKVTDMCINLDGLDELEPNHSQRRHNEPLRQHAIDIMTHWYESHLDNPYPTKADKIKMATEGGVTVTQVKSWFANKRNRTNNTKPKVQKRAMEQKLKELFKDITCNRSIPLAENSHIIEQLSGIINTCHSNKME